MAAAVQIKDLSFSYESDREVLQKINLDIQPGEKFGLIGPMGAGKSTLLLHLNGILSGSGKIFIGDTEVKKDTLATIRRRVGLVFQNPDDQLFSPTVEEEVAFGPLNFGFSHEEVAIRVKDALEAMRLTGLEKAMSHHLSMGERKRVALATVLASEPEVIAFDEPFASLDPPMMSQFVELLKDLPATLVIVSQSILPLISCCDRVGILNNGTIAASGPVREILTNEELMRNNGLDLGFYSSMCRDFFGG